MKSTILAVLAATLMPSPTEAQETIQFPAERHASRPTRSGYIETNGVRYYYEVHGAREADPQPAPVLLLHGGMGNIEMFAPLVPELSGTREVIAVDLHGHGRTGLGDRPAISYDAAGDDMDAILDQLGYDQVDAVGYSMGGGVALQLAAQHPERVRKLVLLSVGHTTDGFYPELLPMQAQVGAAMMPYMVDTPMYQSYVRVAPDPDGFPRLLDAMGALMRQRIDWADDVRSLSMPTMLVVGDSDMFRLESVVEMYRLLGGGQRDAGWMREHMAKNRLAILPGVTHYEMTDSPLLFPVVQSFLDGTMPGPSTPQP